MSEDLNRQLADLVRGRKGRMSLHGCGIRLASDYVRGILDAAGADGAVMFSDPTGMLKDAESRLVYRNEDMGYEPPRTSTPEIDAYCKAIGVDAPPRTLMVFENILTSSREDRDGDVLWANGAVCDPSMPLLWHHMLPAPVGKMLSVREQNDSHVRVASAIMESPLGLDCAALIEFGALRMSHGFRPLEFRPRDKGGHRHNTQGPVGFEIKSFEVMEESLVTVPSNTDAVITAWSRGKLHTPAVKAWAKTFHDNRPALVQAAVAPSFTIPLEVQVTVKATKASDTDPEMVGSGRVPPMMETADDESSEKEITGAPEEKAAVETSEPSIAVTTPADAPEMGKPYPSEHAARQNPPEKYKRFRRESDKLGPGIDAIFGVTEDDKVELQAVRFDASRYTAEEAKKWLKDHDMKTALEAAKEPEKKAANAEEEKAMDETEGGKMTCPKCEYEGEPDEKGKCPKCGEQIEGMKEAPEPDKAGRVLSAANEERLRVAMNTINEVLAQVSTPPSPEPKPSGDDGVPSHEANPLNGPDGTLVTAARFFLEKLFDADNTDLTALYRVRSALQNTIQTIERKRRRQAVAQLFSTKRGPS